MPDVYSFQFQQSSINGLVKITPFFAPDKRGFMSKSFEKSIFAAHGITFSPYEELCSCSKKGVLRGLHFQYHHSQDKIVRVLSGAVYDVAVDLRQDSCTFGKWEGFLLSADNRCMLYIPKGFAHGFLALEDNTLFSYLCGEPYDPATDGGILWKDPQLAVDWPVGQVDSIIMSEKDSSLPTLEEFLKITGGRGLEMN